MGSRARKKWQGDLLSTLPTHKDDEDDSDDEDEDSEEEETAPARNTPKKKAAFALVMDDSSSSSSSEEEEEEEDGNDDDDDTAPELKKKEPHPPSLTSDDVAVTPAQQQHDDEEEEEEDLDAILNEFQQQDLNSSAKGATTSSSGGGALSGTNEFAPILRDMDVRDLDLERSLRTALHSGGDNTGTASTSRRSRTTQLLFGAPPPNAPRPPHYVGGGLGMTSYDRLEGASIPWPYDSRPSQATEEEEEEKDPSYSPPAFTDPSRWYTFQYSDTYARELDDYRQIEQSGDVNALLLFVTHHPYCTAALLQLVSVLKQTNHANEAQQLLKRALWIYECAALPSFHKDLLQPERHALLDGQRPENLPFLDALWELMRQCLTTGLHKSAWAVGRYVWGLDPWRDPLGVLLLLDSLALTCQTDEADQWILDVVQNEYTSQIWYRESETDKDGPTHRGTLTDMPNWAFSYALALFRVHGRDEETSDKALRRALRAFPGVVGMLLQTLEVDTTGRSFRRDWVTVLDKATKRSQSLLHVYLGQDDTIVATATIQAMDFIVKIWLERHAKSWGDSDVLQWLHDNFASVLEEPLDAPPLAPALMRYTRLKAAHYETRVQQFPADANIIDPGLMAQAMVVDANRPRLLRRQQQRQRQDEAMEWFAAAQQQQQQALFGPPNGIV